MIKRTVSFIGFWFVVGVFCLGLPAYAFFTTYPGGPADLYNQIKFEQQQQQYTHTINLTLTGFMFNDIPTAILIKNTLDKTDEKTRIIITIKDNKGGLTSLLQSLRNSAQKSKGYVIFKVKHFGLSCGSYILNAGNVVFVPYDSLLLFHLGSILTVGSSEPEVIRRGSSNPVIMAAYGEAVEMLLPYVRWMNSPEMQDTLDGKDVYITGADICLKKDGRNPDVLFQLKDGCVIRGLKS